MFYSESGQDWHFFEPLITELLKQHGEQVTYITSDPADPGLAYDHTRYASLCIREGLFLIIHFQVLQARLLILTMMDLGNLQLKKSIYPVHYLYLFHSMGSTHMVDHANSYDAYDSLFCAGPHHVAELRRREELAGLQARHLFEYGHPRVEQLMRNRQAQDQSRQGNPQPVALLAPTWGEHCILNQCGEALVGVLLDAAIRVILRPHHHTMRLAPQVVERLLDRYADHPLFELVTQMGESDSLYRSDVLICDWSAMSIEYFLGLEKPVLFIDLPRRIRNPYWADWDIEPLESSIREQAGTVLAPDDLASAPSHIRALLQQREEWRERARAMRDLAVFNIGTSVALGAAEIARLAALASAGPEHEQHHG